MPGTDGYFDAHRLASLPASDRLEATMATRILRGWLSSRALDAPVCTAGATARHTCMGGQWRRSAWRTEDWRRERGTSEERGWRAPNQRLFSARGSRRFCMRRGAFGVTEKADWTVGDYYVVGGSGHTVSDRAVSIRAALEARGVRLVVSAPTTSTPPSPRPRLPTWW